MDEFRHFEGSDVGRGGGGLSPPQVTKVWGPKYPSRPSTFCGAMYLAFPKV